MDRRQRVTLLGIAAAIAVAAVVIALVAGGGDDGEDTTEQTTAAQTQTETQPSPDTTTETTPPEPPKPEPVRIRVEGGEPVGGVEQIELDKGDRAMIDVTADAADEVHMHGYDITKDVGPGKPAKFRFKANLEGIYELELHHSGAQLAEVRVNP